ncbi:TetR family transcriptional regulator [Parvibaculaceae bacterium PLY_AMNH_Bact1]|nr:TetR family transcriptional regulator [Parvibaculaceae bacterium PLY_AMNH_Bact1]
MTKPTKERLLDAAERLCAAQGIDGTSIRAITEAAGANVAAVNFHFDGKAGLIREMFARRLMPLAERRLELLADLRKDGRIPDAGDLLDAFMTPLLDLLAKADPGAQAFGKLFARTVVEPTDAIKEIFGGELTAYSETFLNAFENALPHLDRLELVLRLDFAIGAIAHALSDQTRLTALGEAPAPTRIHASLRTFLIAGFEAPTSSE